MLRALPLPVDVSESRVPLAQALLIVPQAHYRVFAARFQAEMYELFHRHVVTRAVHIVCTPVIVTMTFVLLAHRSLYPAMAIAALLVAYHVAVDRLAGLLTAPLVLSSLALACSFRHLPLTTALVTLIVAGALQAASHAAEPVPPPWTGFYGFTPTWRWLRTAPLSRVAAIAPTTLIFVTLEIWAAPRVWVLQTLHWLLRFGYRPDLRLALEAKVARTLEDSRQGWSGQAGLEVRPA